MEIVRQRKIEGNIWKIYVFHILANLMFVVPVIVLFWQENGLSMTQIMLLQSFFSFLIVILEIPTGYFADIFGRRKSLIYFSVFTFLGTLAYSLGYNFYQFIVAETFLALGFSFMSGADSALVYDTLKDLNKESHYKKIWGDILFYSFIATAVGSVIGGFIGKIDLRWTLYFDIPFVLLTIPLAISLKEPVRHAVIFKKGYIVELLKVVKASVIKNEKIKWLIIYSGIIAGFNGAALWLYQPYFKLSGLDITYFGIVFALFNIVAAVSSRYAHRVEEKLGQRSSLVMLIFLVGISYLLMSNFVLLFSFSFAFLQQFVRGFSRPIIDDYLNKLTNSEIRATVLSANSMVGRLFYAAIIPFVGWIADVYSLTQALMILGITIFALGVTLLFIFHRDRVV